MPELNLGESRLVQGLRALSRSSPQETPPWVKQHLVASFRRHHARGRRRRMFGIAALVAALAMAAGLMLSPRRQTLAPSARGITVEPPTTARSAALSTASLQFIPVLYGEQPPGAGPTIVVRLQMPASALRLVGVSVAEEVSDRTVLAEVAVGQDGLPYAVRLLPSTNQGVEP